MTSFILTLIRAQSEHPSTSKAETGSFQILFRFPSNIDKGKGKGAGSLVGLCNKTLYSSSLLGS